MNNGFTKLFNSIVTSSIWSENDKVRVMWITMLASSDATGHVSGSIPGMAAMARMSLKDAERSIKALCSPDSYSRSKLHEGRRLIEADGGWLIVNYSKYRERRDPEKRRQQNREAQAKYRSKRKVSQNKPKSAQAEAEAEADKEKESVKEKENTYTLQQVKDAVVMNGIPEKNAQSYFDQYNSQGWKKGNGQRITSLRSHMVKRWKKSEQCWDFDQIKSKQKDSITEQVEKAHKKCEL